MCQVKVAPIYTESPDWTEVLVSLPTCFLKKNKTKKTGLAATGWTASWKNFSAALQAGEGI